MLGACSPTSSGGRPVSTSVPVPPRTLPGETLRDALARMFRSCLDNLGIPYEVLEDYVVKYRQTTDLTSDEIAAICEAEAKTAGLIEDRAPTAEELTKNHQRLTKWGECARSAGYDPGRVISLEEYLAVGGAVSLFPDIDELIDTIRNSKGAWEQLDTVCPNGVLVFVNAG